MKILIITDAWTPQFNGVVTTLENTIIQLEERGYEVETINPTQFKTFSCPGYDEIKLSLVRPKTIGKMIESITPHYIHIATEGPLGLAARHYLKKNNQLWSSSFHTKLAEFVESIFGFGSKTVWGFLKWVYKDDSFVLTTTTSMRDELAQLGFDPNRIKIWSA